MILHSTNGSAPAVSFVEGIKNGLAPDGGLYMPDRLPRLPRAFFRNIHEMNVREIAYVVGNTLLGDMLPSVAIKKIVDNALDFDLPITEVGGNRLLLNLYGGPSRSFKDIGARFMRELLKAFFPVGDSRTILLATTGDSGEAMAAAFAADESTNVVMVYPRGEISHHSPIASNTKKSNVWGVEVDGTFDQCQNLVKEVLLADLGADSMRLTSGNSMNLARELPAIIFVFYAYAQALARTEGKGRVVISIPCGSLGTMAAALMAKQMGLPVDRFIAANNANDVFVEYLKTGGFRPREALLTLARAMDVGNPANMARISHLYGGDLSRLRADVEGYSYSDDEIAETMREVYSEYGLVVEPQCATALRALQRHTAPEETGVAIAGVDPRKSADVIGKVMGIELAGCESSLHELKVSKIPPTRAALERVLQNVASVSNRKSCGVSVRGN